MGRGSAALIALILSLGVLSNVYADYTYIPLNYPGASSTQCGGINDAGTIDGTYTDTGSNADDSGHGFVLTGGVYTPVNYPNSSGTWIDGGINNAGAVVGEYQTAAGACNGFLLSNGAYTSLTYPGATGCTCAIGINNAGTIVGRYKAGSVTHGFMLSSGNYSSLTYPGSTYTRANDINNEITTVGYYQDAGGVNHGFVLSGGLYTSVDFPGASQTSSASGFSGTVATGINDAGTVVGYYTDTNEATHGFLFSGGTYTSLDYPDATLTGAFSINNGGIIVGAYTDASGVNHGFKATPNATAILTLSVTKSGSGSGTVTSSPSGIDCGSTCASTYYTGTTVTLTPVPDAGSYFLGWSSPCSGNAPCGLTPTTDTHVAATFGLQAPAYYDTVQKVYIGYYQRPADPVGLLYWAERLNVSQGSLNDIIQAYANSAESQALYGTITSSNIATVVNSIYMALFNRPAEAGGLAFYVNGFDSGQFTAATIMLNVLYGAQGSDLQTLNNKLAATNLFTKTIDPELDGLSFQVTYAGDQDVIMARAFLAAVTADTATVPTQAEVTAWMKANIAVPGDPILSH